MDKDAVLAALRAKINDELQAAIRAQKSAHEGATHEESRAENDKDTRGLEASYLARGLAERVASLHETKSAFGVLPARLDHGAPGALMLVEDEDGEESVYFLGPAAGGLAVEVEGRTLKVVTPSSPLGKALRGKRVGDELALRTPKGSRELVVTQVL